MNLLYLIKVGIELSPFLINKIDIKESIDFSKLKIPEEYKNQPFQIEIIILDEEGCGINYMREESYNFKLIKSKHKWKMFLKTEFSKGDPMVEVEATKTVAEAYAPMNCKIIEVNSSLDVEPEIINNDPVGDGWMVKAEILEMDDSGMSYQEYESFIS